MGFRELTATSLTVLVVCYLALVVASITVAILRARMPHRDLHSLHQRVRTWWVIAIIFTIAISFSRNLSLTFFAFVSFLALKEYFSLIPARRADRRVMFWAYASIPLQYLWIGLEWYGMFIVWIPVYVFLFLPLRMIVIGETTGFLNAISSIQWGLVITVFSISHAAYLLVLPPEINPIAGGTGLVLFLVVLTESNDMFQFIWGKLFGKRKIVPSVSPNKTIEGFVGGLVSTSLLSVALGPLLTPYHGWTALGIGAVIAASGFVGDVVISALKRDLNIKDSGTLLPGHGGILDRIDSLSYTAPIFFHLTHYLFY